MTYVADKTFHLQQPNKSKCSFGLLMLRSINTPSSKAFDFTVTVTDFDLNALSLTFLYFRAPVKP